MNAQATTGAAVAARHRDAASVDTTTLVAIAKTLHASLYRRNTFLGEWQNAHNGPQGEAFMRFDIKGLYHKERRDCFHEDLFAELRDYHLVSEVGLQIPGALYYEGGKRELSFELNQCHPDGTSTWACKLPDVSVSPLGKVSLMYRLDIDAQGRPTRVQVQIPELKYDYCTARENRRLLGYPSDDVVG